MVVMLLDHSRNMFMGFTPKPTDMAVTWPALFMTRWVTHFCAPVFVLLAGVSARLYGRRVDHRTLSRFLLTRGLWLVVLEWTVIHFAMAPDPLYRIAVVQVIWALGWGMVLLGIFCRLPVAVVGWLGLAIVAGHNALPQFGAGDHWLGLMLFGHGQLMWAPGHKLMVVYAIVPWAGVMFAGYGLGELLMRVPDRRVLLRRLGIALVAVFVVLRWTGLYGDPAHWATQRSDVFTLMDFLNTTKYPPSLLYLCMTLGPALLLLAWLDGRTIGPWQRRLMVFGTVPMFFYIIHLYWLRLTSFPIAFARFGPAAMDPPPGPAGVPGFDLWGVYAVFFVSLVVLYFPTRWYAGFKAQRDDWWLRYL